MNQSSVYFTAFFWLFVCFFVQADENQQRDLVIIVDQEANIGEYNAATVWYLRSALHNKVCPILVDINLVQDLVHRWFEFGQRSLEQDTQECLILSIHTHIMERLAHWSKFFIQFSQNPAMVDTLAQEKVKEELAQRYSTPQKIDEGSLQNFVFYLAHDLKKEWDVYKVNEHFCLLVPIDYCNASHSNTDKDSLSGLKLSACTYVQDVFCPNVFTFLKTERPHFELLHTLEQLFIPSSYAWNIFLIGHGLDRKMYNRIEFEQLVADLSIAEFQQILSFFNTAIKMNLFLYQTCYGAGKHLHEVYQDCTTNQPIILNYPVIILNLTDVPSYSKVMGWHSNESFTHLNLTSYHYNVKTQRWELLCDFYRPSKKAFKLLRKINFSDCFNNVGHLWHMLQLMYQNILESTPHLRLAQQQFFMPLFSIHDILCIDSTLVEMKKVSNLPLAIKGDTKFILLAVEQLDVPLHLKSPVSRIVSILPGKATHSIKQIEALTYSIKDLIGCFWPLRGMAFDKVYFIKELVVNPQFLINHELSNDSYKQPTITLHNMVIFIDKDRFVKFFFEVNNEKAWGGFARTIFSEDDEELRVSPYILDQEATKKYQNLCQELCTTLSERRDTKNETLIAMIDALKKIDAGAQPAAA